MKYSNRILILVVGILLAFLSYRLDSSINLIFQNADIPIFGVILSVITNFGVVILLMVIVPTVLIYARKRKIAYVLWSNLFISMALTFAFKLIIARQRPIESFTYPFTNMISYSFPSMHAVVAFSLMAIANKLLPKQRVFWTSFAFLVAFSRIYFGVHYLSDVVFGALIGYFIGSFLYLLHKHHFHVKN